MKKKKETKAIFPFRFYFSVMINIQEKYYLMDLYHGYATYAKNMNYRAATPEQFYEYIRRIGCLILSINNRLVVYFAKNPAVVVNFLKERNCKSSETNRIEISNLYNIYKTYCEKNKQDAGSLSFFRMKLQQIGFRTEETEKTWYVYLLLDGFS